MFGGVGCVLLGGLSPQHQGNCQMASKCTFHSYSNILFWWGVCFRMILCCWILSLCGQIVHQSSKSTHVHRIIFTSKNRHSHDIHITRNRYLPFGSRHRFQQIWMKPTCQRHQGMASPWGGGTRSTIPLHLLLTTGCTVVWYQHDTVTLPETNIAPENGWLEYYLPFGILYFFNAQLICFILVFSRACIKMEN